jgi:hypothetical protein
VITLEISEFKERIRKRRFLMDAFLYTSSLRGGSDEKSVLKQAVTGYYLQAVVLELVIKMLYELDRKKAAPFSHRLGDIFHAINQESQEFLEARFDEARDRRRKQFAKFEDVVFHPLGQVLSNNERIVRDFKYEAVGVPVNSAADGRFYREICDYIDGRAA